MCGGHTCPVRLSNGRIIQGHQRLRQLEKELGEKRHHVHTLQTQLDTAQDCANQSASVIKGLQATQGGVSRQLENSQTEIEKTRGQIATLQEELENLRQQVPVLPTTLHLSPASSENQPLIQECASFHILTRDRSVLRVFQDLKKAAVTPNPLLLLGETGTGKEVFAKAAHALSLLNGGPFISVNMAAIRPELFEGELFGHVKGAFTGAVGRDGYIQAANGGRCFWMKLANFRAICNPNCFDF